MYTVSLIEIKYETDAALLLNNVYTAKGHCFRCVCSVQAPLQTVDVPACNFTTIFSLTHTVRAVCLYPATDSSLKPAATPPSSVQ